jgi:hypothetical protein
MACLAIASPYRVARLTAFLDPWADQFKTGYQLTQALIAFGRGGWFGAGLGDSVQKMFYLPEAHTDFLFAVLAEEMGFFGILMPHVWISKVLERGKFLIIFRFLRKFNRSFETKIEIVKHPDNRYTNNYISNYETRPAYTKKIGQWISFIFNAVFLKEPKTS